MRKRVFVALFAAALLVAACGGGDDATETAPDNDAGGAQPLPVTVTAANLAFDQDALTAHATHEVELTLVNDDSTAHTFTIDELDVDVEAGPGEEATTTFTPDEIGTLEFYCRFHPAMKGELKVE